MESEIKFVHLFIPSKALEYDTCLLVGWKSKDGSARCVSSHVDLTHAEAFESSINSERREEYRIIGILDNALHSPDMSLQCQKWIQKHQDCIYLTNNNTELPECHLGPRVTYQNGSTTKEVVVIIFDACALNSSHLLRDDTSDKTTRGLLYHGWQAGLQGSNLLNTTEVPVMSFSPTDGSTVDKLLEYMSVVTTKLLLVLSTIVLFLCDGRLCGGVLCRVPKPAVVHHLLHRARQTKVTVGQQQTTGTNRPCKLQLTNLLWKQVIDVLLGLAVTYMLVAGNHTTAVADTVMDWAQTVASELQRLLQWMMGVPAGLKLNDELAHFLGQFFLYHIYLWTGYLSFLRPLWTDAVWYISMSGCLGLTFQMSLIQDLLSLITLHSYCFYVYAARLYSLQVYGLLSLWRLFRGKKWNPLFQRVDSSSYDVDQLFIGTLLFTILLFLLPTTGLFYIVFTALRLVVLGIQGIIYKCVGVLDAYPLYLLYLRLFSPSRVAGDVRLHVLPSLPNRPLYHCLQLLPVPLSDLWLIGSRFDIPCDVAVDTWSSLVNKVMMGHLIYPWIKPHQ